MRSNPLFATSVLVAAWASAAAARSVAEGNWEATPLLLDRALSHIRPTEGGHQLRVVAAPLNCDVDLFVASCELPFGGLSRSVAHDYWGSSETFGTEDIRIGLLHRQRRPAALRATRYAAGTDEEQRTREDTRGEGRGQREREGGQCTTCNGSAPSQ